MSSNPHIVGGTGIPGVLSVHTPTLLAVTQTVSTYVPRQGRPIPVAVAEATMRAAGVEPLDPFPGSRKPWRSRCYAKGHETSPTLYGINEGRHPCRYCAADLIYPDEAVAFMEERGLRPLAAFSGAHDKWACLCLECGEPVSTTYRTIAKRKTDRRGCDSCCRPGGVFGEPQDARERMRAAGFEPLAEWPGSAVPWRSRCLNCVEECAPVYHGVTNTKGLGCRECSIKLQDRTRFDADEAVAIMRAVGLEPQEPFQTLDARWKCCCLTCGDVVFRQLKPVRAGLVGGCRHPRLQREAAYDMLEELGLEPTAPYPGANREAVWSCRCTECDREWSPRVSALRACGYCTGKVFDPQEAVERLRERGMLPLEPYPGTGSAEWRAKCQGCDTIRTRSYLGYLRNACPVCTGRSLDEAGMVHFMRENGWETLVPFESRETPWESRCIECENVSSPTFDQVRYKGRCCQWCTGRLMTDGERLHRLEVAGFTPQEPYPGTKRAPWKMKCNQCEQEVTPTFDRILRTGSASCCGSPWDLSRSDRLMMVYLVTHGALGAAKVGVALEVNGVAKRLREHERAGWEVHATWGTLESLTHALDVERVVLNRWRADGLPPHVAQNDMPQDGYTETVSLAAIDLDEVTALIDTSIADLAGGGWATGIAG